MKLHPEMPIKLAHLTATAFKFAENPDQFYQVDQIFLNLRNKLSAFDFCEFEKEFYSKIEGVK